MNAEEEMFEVPQRQIRRGAASERCVLNSTKVIKVVKWMHYIYIYIFDQQACVLWSLQLGPASTCFSSSSCPIDHLCLVHLGTWLKLEVYLKEGCLALD